MASKIAKDDLTTMIDIAVTLFAGALASALLLLIAPLPVVYVAAFLAFTPILAVVFWRARELAFGALRMRAPRRTPPLDGATSG